MLNEYVIGESLVKETSKVSSWPYLHQNSYFSLDRLLHSPFVLNVLEYGQKAFSLKGR